MAWELCAELEKPSLSPSSVLSVIDEKLVQGGINKYKAFRLLTSDLGKVFFKALSGNMYKPKSGKSVLASKQNWCSSHPNPEWCMV